MIYTLPILWLQTMTAHAWEPKLVNGQPVTWKTHQIDFYINTEKYTSLPSETIENAIVSAAESWSAQQYGASTEFNYMGTTKKQGADFSDNIYVVSFDDTWNNDPSLLAVTHVWNDSNGEIVHFDIEINMDGVQWATDGSSFKHDIQNSLAHEFGHALGLEHSDDIESTMAPTTTMGETQKRDIGTDDIMGFTTLYPINSTEIEEQSASNTNSNSNSGGSSGGFSNSVNSTPTNTGSGSTPVQLERAGCAHTQPTALLWGLVYCGAISWRFRRKLGT